MEQELRKKIMERFEFNLSANFIAPTGRALAEKLLSIVEYEQANFISSNATLADSLPNWKEKYETAIQQKINLQKEADRLREKYEPGIVNEYKGA